MIYSLIALVATILGAVIGVGGGLVIRPALAFMGVEAELASFTSSAAVLAMAVVTLLVYKKQKVKIEFRRTGFMAAGSVAGGFLGAGLIPLAPAGIINIGYIFVLAAVVVITIGKERFGAKKKIGNPGALLIGGVTGLLSGFFGVGGGPFQMAALMLCFKMKARDAAVQSIAITLLTTVSALARYTIDGAVDFSLALYMIPMAVAGGLIGGLLNRRMKSGLVRKLFIAVITGMIILQCATIGIKG